MGVQGKCVKNCGKLDNVQMWMGPLEGNAYALAIINFSDEEAVVPKFDWSELGLSHSTYHVRNIWTHKNEGIFSNTYGSKGLRLKAHASKFLKLTHSWLGDCELHPDDPTPFESKPCHTISF